MRRMEEGWREAEEEEWTVEEALWAGAKRSGHEWERSRDLEEGREGRRVRRGGERGEREEGRCERGEGDGY